MATNKFVSNIEGKNGTETITNFATIGDSSTAFSGSAVTATGAVQGSTVRATSYMRIGNKYIFSGTLDTMASLVAVATAITATPIGSMYMGKGRVWVFTANDSASVCGLVA